MLRTTDLFASVSEDSKQNMNESPNWLKTRLKNKFSINERTCNLMMAVFNILQSSLSEIDLSKSKGKKLSGKV